MKRRAMTKQERADFIYERLLDEYAADPASPKVAEVRAAWRVAQDEANKERELAHAKQEQE